MIVRNGASDLGQTQEAIITSEVPVPPARVHGERTLADDRHEPLEGPVAGPTNPLGADGSGANSDVGELSRDDPVRLSEVKIRFEANSGRLKDSSKADYWRYFEKFATFVRLASYTRRQLEGAKGKELLVTYLKGLSPFSRSTYGYGIKKVWRRGLVLAWPLDREDLPPSSRRNPPGPRRPDVEPWVNAARNESDAYERAWFSVELTYGLRPVNQQAHLRRRDVVFNEVTGKPIGLVASGAEEGFKTDSYLVAGFPLETSDAVADWLKKHPNASSDALLFPWRSADGTVNSSAETTEKMIGAMRHRFAKRWKLPWLTSKDMRKFVRGVLNDSGMPKPYRHAWQGHQLDRTDMDSVYGGKPWEETFESQLRYLPSGPMGLFGKIQTIHEEIPAELIDLWRRFRAREIDRMDFADSLKKLEQRTNPDILVKP